MIKRPTISKFRGLNTVADPLRLGLSWLVQADNVDITDKFQLQRCKGHAKVSTNAAISGGYATKDLGRLFVIDSGELRELNSDYSYRVLRTGLSSAQYYFEEVAGVVYYTNGTDYGLIRPDMADHWGIAAPAQPVLTTSQGSLNPGLYQVVCTYTDSRGLESGNSLVVERVLVSAGSIQISGIPHRLGYTTNVYVTETDGRVFFLLSENNASAACSYDADMPLSVELPFQNTDTPRGKILSFWAGQMYAAEWFQGSDLSVIWCSLPGHYHHFDTGSHALIIPGEVRVLGSVDAALVIGTDRSIYAYDGQKLVELAAYGVVGGYSAARLGADLFLWTLRGLCKMMPFQNLTENTISVAPGLSAGGTIMERLGQKRYVVSLQRGGNAYNSR